MTRPWDHFIRWDGAAVAMRQMINADLSAEDLSRMHSDLSKLLIEIIDRQQQTVFEFPEAEARFRDATDLAARQARARQDGCCGNPLAGANPPVVCELPTGHMGGCKLLGISSRYPTSSCTEWDWCVFGANHNGTCEDSDGVKRLLFIHSDGAA
jgi:hypothetical protein